MQIKKLETYCKKMLLDFEIEDDILTLGDAYFQIIEDDDMKLFDEDMEFIPNKTAAKEIDGFVYEFGGRWYIQIKDEEVDLKELHYLGKAKEKMRTKSFLGIRSSYELMNGMGLYKEWIKKAKFLGIEALGICERNTLSGALVFQNECENNNIKSIIGITIPVKGIDVFDIKLYAKNFQGWLNLLKFNTRLNVDKDPFIDLEFLLENKSDLYIIADPKSMNFREVEVIEEVIDFYQLDTVQFLNEDKDVEYINNLEKFILSELEPISITDAFYLEKGDYRTREVMWTVAKAFDERTNNQFFKSKSQYAIELINMFDKEEKGWIHLYKTAEANENELVENCNFKYDTDTRHLPKYIMTDEESSEFKTNDELFLHLIKKGFKERGIKNPNQYLDRLKVEIEVLRMGDVIDYFLALHDIIQKSKREGFLTGIGRGSAGGSLIAYLLNIIQIDPLEFDLLFERFLNSGRMGEYQDRPLFTLTLEDGSEVKLAEGALVRVLRDDEEKVVLVHDIEEGDDLIKY